ncbi:hypothetical protein [Wolbachia endosymbiont of Atemnus politus]|uniref:hypothetical protein n=1 Tax=Wolbachia endosymbiont of Atemnus politus TaxID=2682840 RepID=UPI0034E2A597
MQNRETAVGIPSLAVIAESYVEAENINITGTATRITWSSVFCNAGQEYAIIIPSDDADTAVKIGELGKHDAINSRWVTGQPYQVGILLSSRNACPLHRIRILTIPFDF